MADAVVGFLRVGLGIDSSDLKKGAAEGSKAIETFKSVTQKSLAEVEAQMGKASGAVARMVASLRGDQLLKSANSWVQAVEKIGGATRLAERDQAKVNATLQKAIAQYQLLGQVAPKAMVDLEMATRKATVSTDAMVAGLSRAGKEASASGRLLAGMGAAGKKAADDTAAALERAARPMSAMVAGLSAAGNDAGRRLAAGMGLAGQQAARAQAAAASRQMDVATLVGEFRGDSMVRDAQLAVEAVEKIGGATRLTKVQQEDLNRTLSDAIAKYRALGQDAPKSMVALEQATRPVQNRLALLGNNLRTLGDSASQVGLAMSVGLTAPIVAFGTSVARSAIQFESSFAGVRKTVKGTEQEFQQMEGGLRALSREIPISVNELNRLAESAGAMGIPKAEIVDFTRVMALLGVTTNLTSEQAAESIGKIQNIFGSAGKDTERLASTLVALGNDGASTETQILEMATRIASAGNQIGMTQGQVLGFASALASVGLEAEAGGTAISRVFVDIAEAVSIGGDGLRQFSDVAGMETAKFAALFKRDASQAVLAFIEGLGRMKKSGGDVLATLRDMGIEEVRLRDTILRAVGAGDLLSKALDVQADAWARNSALTDEARERFKTTESQLGLLWNRIKDVAVTVGNAMLPTINLLVRAFNQFIPVLDVAARAFESMPGPLQAAVIGLAALAAAAGPTLFVMGSLARGAVSLIDAWVLLRPAATVAAAATTTVAAAQTTATATTVGLTTALRTSTLAFVASPVGIGLLVAALATIVIPSALSKMSKTLDDVSVASEGTTRRLLETSDAYRILGESKQKYDKLVNKDAKPVFGPADLRLNETQLVGLRDRLFDASSAADASRKSVQSLTDQEKALRQEVAALLPTVKAQIDAGVAMGLNAKDISAELRRMGDGYRASERVIQAYISNNKSATKATEDLAKAQRQLTDQLFGRDVLADAKEMTDALFSGGPVDFSKIGDDQLKRIKETTSKAIKLYKDMGAAVPPAVQRAYNQSAAQVGTALDLSALSGLTLQDIFDPSSTMLDDWDTGLRSVFGLSTEALIAQEREFALAAAGMSELDVSGLNQMELGADGAWHAFGLLNESIFDLRKNFSSDPMKAWAVSFDMLTRSLDQAGVSVQVFTQAALSGWQAASMMRSAQKSGALSDKFAASVAGGSSLIASTGSGGKASRVAGGAISGAMMTSAGAAMLGVKTGMWAGPWGAAIGAGVGAAIGFVRSRIVSKEEKDARAAFTQWQQQVITNYDLIAKEQGRVTSGMANWEKMVASVADAYAATGRTVEDVHKDLQVVSDATHHSAQEVLAALDKINGALSEQAADVELLDATLAKYGFSLDETGDKFQAKTLHGQAKQLAEEYRVLLDNGVDAAAIHERMSGSVSQWLQDTIRTGTAIPSLMQPILESFAKQGKLLDENGLLMDEAAVKGLDFKDVWTDGMDRVAVKLDAVIKRLGAMVSMLTGMPAETVQSAQNSIAGQTLVPPAVSRTVTIFGRTVTIPPASSQVQVPSQFMGPLTLPDGATSAEDYFRQFDPATMPKTMHTGGIVERAHNGAVVGRHLFGRMASDEMPMILQRGEAVIKKYRTSLMGGASWADAVNRGDMSSAVSMMTRGAAMRDPFADMGRLIEMPNRFHASPPAAGSAAAALTSAGKGDTTVNLTIQSGAINVNGSGNPAHDADVILNEVVAGLHTNRKGFRTKVIQKVAKGN